MKYYKKMRRSKRCKGRKKRSEEKREREREKKGKKGREETSEGGRMDGQAIESDEEESDLDLTFGKSGKCGSSSLPFPSLTRKRIQRHERESKHSSMPSIHTIDPHHEHKHNITVNETSSLTIECSWEQQSLKKKVRS